MTRTPHIFGNWKMNKTRAHAREYFSTLLQREVCTDCHIGLSVPFTLLHYVASLLETSPILPGAQNLSTEKEGAFTGEVSAKMIADSCGQFVLIGHSERRHLFGETDQQVHKKLCRALEEHLLPVLCVGETEEQRKAGDTESVLRKQLTEATRGLTPEQAKTLRIAYEPVWAIGTGLTATTVQAEESHSFLRKLLERIFDSATALDTPILYGGSVKAANAANLLSQENIDGVLVGGASLDPEEFVTIMENCSTGAKL